MENIHENRVAGVLHHLFEPKARGNQSNTSDEIDSGQSSDLSLMRKSCTIAALTT